MSYILHKGRHVFFWSLVACVQWCYWSYAPNLGCPGGCHLWVALWGQHSHACHSDQSSISSNTCNQGSVTWSRVILCSLIMSECKPQQSFRKLSFWPTPPWVHSEIFTVGRYNGQFLRFAKIRSNLIDEAEAHWKRYDLVPFSFRTQERIKSQLKITWKWFVCHPKNGYPKYGTLKPSQVLTCGCRRVAV